MFSYNFHFSEDARHHIEGVLTLEDPSPEPGSADKSFRAGTIALQDGRRATLCLAHSPATADFMYVRRTAPDARLFELLGLTPDLTQEPTIWLPGQVTLGPVRTQIAGQAISDAIASPGLRATLEKHPQNDIVVLPVLREGAKYQIAEALHANCGYYCDEAILDSHHVYDPTVPRYNRRVETTIVKDQDISEKQRRDKKLAIIGDSIASGVVMLGVLALLQQRFENISQLEIVAPFATLRGLARLVFYSSPRFQVRVHIFETILNALPPDFYYSAHFAEPEFHIRPDLEERYRRWWGQDDAGNSIADTACAGYGWAEAFFNPRKQIQMIDEQLLERHQLTVADVVKRNLTGASPVR